VGKLFYEKLNEKAIFDALFEEALRLYEERGWLAIPFIIEKNGLKYSKRPVGKWSRLKNGEVSLEEYWQSLSAKEELLVSGIGIIAGEVSKVTIVDVDAPEKFEEQTGLKVEQLLNKTLAAKTISGGYHFYFKYASDIQTGTYQHLGFDIRNDGALAVIPPSFCMEDPPKEVIKALGLSIDTDGPKYEWINNKELMEFPEELRLILKRKESKKTTKAVITKEVKPNIRKLSEEEISKLADLLVPIWKQGYRNSLTIYLLGLLYKSGVDKESAEKLIDRITTLANDEEKKYRLGQVTYQYEFYLPRKEYSSIKGWKGITEILEELKKEKIISEEGVNYILSQLQEIFPYDRETLKHSKTYVVMGFNPKKGFVNDTKNCWIANWRETQDGWKLKNIYLFTALTSLTINYDPYRDQKTYIATFKKKVGDEYEYLTLEGSLEEIYARLRAEALVVRRDAKEVLSAIFNEFEKRNLAKIERKASIRGFVLDNGKLVLNRHNLPPLEEERVKEALLLLNRYINQFAKKKKAETVTVLKWALVSPFNWIKKQTGKRNLFKWLFLIGSPDTGKTTDAELFTRWIWNLEENNTSGSSLKTASRVGKKANTWTFSFVVNEASSLFSNRANPQADEIRELLRQVWDGTVAREIRRNNGERIVELAAATFIFTANKHPHLYPADAKRIMLIKYNPRAKVSRVEKDLFETVFRLSEREKLAYIGAAVYEWAKEEKNLQLILDLDDFNLVGGIILEELYSKYVGEVPDWISLAYEDDDLEEEEPTKEDVLTVLVKRVNQLLFPKLGMSLAQGKVPVVKRLLLAKNLDPSLPYEVDLEKGLLYIKRGFLRILKEEDFEVASLIDLAAITGGEYTRVHNEKLGLKGNKVVAIPLEWLSFLDGREVSLLNNHPVISQDFEVPEEGDVDLDSLDLSFEDENEDGGGG